MTIHDNTGGGIMFKEAVFIINELCSPGDFASAAAQDNYEAGVIEEARSIVNGECEAQPAVEHLRILLAWLDGSGSHPLANEDAPF